MITVSSNKKQASVFCGSSSRVAGHFLDGARSVARVLCDCGLGIVYGGGGVGMMGALADEALACGGDVQGIIPRFMVEREWAHPGLSNMDIVGTMAERKTRMLELGDIVIALPGGMGTLDEFFEATTLSQLGRLRSPLLIFNQAGYFDPLISLRDHMQVHGFIDSSRTAQWHVVADAEALRSFIERWCGMADREVNHASG